MNAGALLPFRFRLRHSSEFEVTPASYLIEVAADAANLQGEASAQGAALPTGGCVERARDFQIDVDPSRASTHSYEVSGTLRLRTGTPVRGDGIALTAVLLSKEGEVLEVVTGTPDVRALQASNGLLDGTTPVRFVMVSPVPLGKWVARVDIVAEVLPAPQAPVR